MKRNFLSGTVTLLMLFAVGCDKKQSAPDPTPAPTVDAHAGHDHTGMEERAERQLEFIALAMVEHKETLSKVTCHCCAKPLAQCYAETLQGLDGACPPT